MTFVDTKGADPGISSEEHAQSEAIAICLQAFMTATRTDSRNDRRRRRLRRRARAWRSPITSLCWSTARIPLPRPRVARRSFGRMRAKRKKPRRRLKLTADDLHRFGIVDEILPEPLGGAHRNANDVVTRTLDAVDAALARLTAMTPRRSWRRATENTVDWENGKAEAQEPVSTAR